MKADSHANLRLKELVARIETEQDPEEITALIKALNHLLDGGQHLKKAVAGSPTPTEAARTQT